MKVIVILFALLCAACVAGEVLAAITGDGEEEEDDEQT